MSLHTEPWWDTCVSRVATESIERLAQEYRVDVETLAEALAEEGRGGPAQRAPWWPEALRELESGVSIRQVARRFHTEPRRIRRALARTAMRAGGVAFGSEGLPALAEFVDRLGREPDQKIAAEAHVSVEAVQGERRRRGVVGYQQRRTRRPRLSADDMQWIRGPKRNRREKFKPEADVTVVRRPQRNEAPVPTMVVRRNLDGDRGHFEAAPRAPERPAWTPRAEEPRPPERPWVKSERQEEIDQLLSVQRRQRDGRQRIVRADNPRPEPVEPERSPRVVRRVAAPGTSWRAVDPALAPPAPEPPRPVLATRPPSNGNGATIRTGSTSGSPSVAANNQPERVVRYAPVPVAPPLMVAEPTAERPAAPAGTRREPEVTSAVGQAVVKAAEPAPAVVKAAEPPPAVAKAAEPPPAVAKAAEPPPAVAKAAEPEASVRVTRKVVRARPAESAPAPVSAPAPEEPVVKRVRSVARREEPAPANAPAPVAWYVEAPGGDGLFVVHAVDVTEALIAAAARLPPAVLARACIWRVGDPKPAV